MDNCNTSSLTIAYDNVGTLTLTNPAGTYLPKGSHLEIIISGFTNTPTYAGTNYTVTSYDDSTNILDTRMFNVYPTAAATFFRIGPTPATVSTPAVG